MKETAALPPEEDTRMPRLETADFTRTDTKAVKGIAAVMMLLHHLAGFPGRFPVGFGGFTDLPAGYLLEIAVSADLCVSLFFFLGGYGLYIRWQKQDFSVSRSILELYKAYWKVFLVFVPIALVFFRRSGADINYLATLYNVDSKAVLLTTLISNFTAYTCSLNPEWWFLKNYIAVFILGYLYCLATKRVRNFWVELAVVFGIEILTHDIFPGIAKVEAFSGIHDNIFYVNFLTLDKRSVAFFIGIVFAKYGGICRLKALLRRIPFGTAAAFVGACAVYWSRVYILGSSGDLLYCALLVPMMSVVLDKLGFLKKGFAFLGSHSTNLWLIHTFFCYYFLEATKLVYCTGSVVVDLCILLALSLTASLALEWFWKAVGKLARKSSALSVK